MVFGLTISALHADDVEAEFRAAEKGLIADWEELQYLKGRLEEQAKHLKSPKLDPTFREAQRDDFKRRLREYKEKETAFIQKREVLKVKYRDQIFPSSTPAPLTASRVSGMTLVSDDAKMAVFKTPEGQSLYVNHTSLKLTSATWQEGTFRCGLQAVPGENGGGAVPARVFISSYDSTTGDELREEVSQELRGGQLTWTLNAQESSSKDPLLMIQLKSEP